MTEKEEERIRQIMTEVVSAHAGCPNGIDANTAATLKKFADAVQTRQKTALKAFITLAIGALCAAIIAGAKEIFGK